MRPAYWLEMCRLSFASSLAEDPLAKACDFMARLFIHAEGAQATPRELNWGITRLGRAPDNDIVLTDLSVSHHHCEFELGLDALVLRDRNSTNGSFVNDQKVAEAKLHSGNRLRFGAVSAVIEWSEESVVVPAIAVRRPPESVPLGDTVMSCRNHVTVASVWYCPQCRQYFCGKCTRGVNLVGRPVHKLCPLCSAHVELAPWAEARPQKQTLWRRVKRAFNRTKRLR